MYSNLAQLLALAEKLEMLGMRLYATPDTAAAIGSLGMDVTVVPSIAEGDGVPALLDSGKIGYIIEIDP